MPVRMRRIGEAESAIGRGVARGEQFAASSAWGAQERPDCASGPLYKKDGMQPLKKFTEAFIYTFGITPPRPEEERTTTIFISTFMAGAILFLVGLGELILHAMF